MLNLEQSPGIGEIIVDGLAPESAAQRLNASLDVYTAGKIDDRALEILRSNALGNFLNILSDGYDHVLVDVAPVNHFPDAQVLVGMLKDVVLVAHTDRTPREAVAQAKKRLESGGGKIAGLVLNLRTYPIPKFLYKRV
jgi:Mrp family chromosome partitioning ATPase